MKIYSSAEIVESSSYVGISPKTSFGFICTAVKVQNKKLFFFYLTGNGFVD